MTFDSHPIEFIILIEAKLKESNTKLDKIKEIGEE